MADDMIRVTGPDGSTFSFPTGTPSETIRASLGKHYGASATQAPQIDERDTSQARAIGTPEFEREIDVARRAGVALNGQQGAFGRVGGFDPIAANIPFSDELVSGMAGIGGLFNGRGFGEEYQRQMEAEKAAKDAYAQQHPVKNIAGTLAGGLMTGPGAIQTAAAQGLGRGVLTGAVQGAGYGGVSGLSEGQGADRLTNAATGAGIGAAIGAGAPLVVSAGAGLINAGKRVVSPVTNAIANRLAPEEQAAQAVQRAFERDGIPLEQAAQRMEQQGAVNPDAVLADFGGASVRGTARAATNVPSAAREEILRTVESRNLAQPDRVIDKVEGLLSGNADDFAKGMARQIETREKIASPMYRKAFEEKPPVNVTGVVKHIDDQITPGVEAMANPAADLRPDGISATLERLRSFFTTEKNQRFDLKQLHQVKTEIDGMIGVAKRSGDDAKARALLGVQNELVRAMDKASPLYGDARKMFAGAHTLQDAGETGANIFNMSAGDVRAATESMSKAERDMFTLGVAKAIREKVNSVSDGRDIAKAVFGNTNIRETIKAAMPDAQTYRKFQAQMMRETQMRRTSNAINGNSTSMQQAADLIDMKNTGSDTLTALTKGKFGEAAMSVVKQILFGEKGISEKTAEGIGRLLMSRDPQRIRAAIKMLKDKQVRDESIMSIVNMLTSAGSKSAEVAYPQIAN